MKINDCKLCKFMKNAIYLNKNNEYGISQFCEFNNEDIKKIKTCKYLANKEKGIKNELKSKSKTKSDRKPDSKFKIKETKVIRHNKLASPKDV